MVKFAEIDICTLTIMHRFTSLNFRKSEYTTVFSFDRYQLILSWDSAITDPLLSSFSLIKHHNPRIQGPLTPTHTGLPITSSINLLFDKKVKQRENCAELP